jgi:hypothetical protein
MEVVMKDKENSPTGKDSSRVSSRLSEVVENIADHVRVEHELNARELIISLHVPTKDIARARLEKTVALLVDAVV